MSPLSRRFVSAFLALTALTIFTANANTTITFTRNEVTNMANLWETDSISISALANSQYPTVAGTWDFVFPHSSISSDGDVHIDMAISSNGTGSSSNNTGASPIVSEVINCTQTQLSHLTSLNSQRVNVRGVFRFYTEHSSERHFELHPITQLQRWNGSTFVLDTDYTSTNITADPDGTTHSSSVLKAVFDGTYTMTAAIASDNVNINFTCPSPSVNYTQYAGTALTAVQTDALGQYFMFRPNLVSSATVRCRLISNSAAASAAAASLSANQSLTVNALTRTDMSAVNAIVSTMNAGDSQTFTRPIELIVLGLPGFSPGPTPTPTATPSPTVTPTATPTPTPTASPFSGTFANHTSVTVNGSSAGKAAPYPAAIAVSGMVGKISKVTVQLVSLSTDNSDYASDLDFQIVGPGGQNVMIMSDAGGTHSISTTTPITLTFDDAAASLLSHFNQLASGTYKPTNYTGDADAFPAPAPSTTPGTALSVYNNTNPNGTWNLFGLNEYPTSLGTVSSGWSLTIQTVATAPDVATVNATNITSTTATLNGTINPLGTESTYQFQFGTTTAYGFTQVVESAGSGTSGLPISVNLVGLKPATTYHYRITGSNDIGDTNGADKTFTTAAFVDSDHDGIPDDYEAAHNLNMNNAGDANLDSDGDGMTNLQEYLAGTDPNSASSNFRIITVESAGGDVDIVFPSVFGKSYRVEQGVSPQGPWSILSDNIAGTGDLVDVEDVEALDSAQQRFYHVIVLP